MRSLTWPVVRSWRMARQHLAHGTEAPWIEEAVRDAAGIQTQVASSAEHGILLRTAGAAAATAADVRAAVWEHKTLIRTWAMRGTLHLLATEDYPAFVAALGTRQHWRQESWLRTVGMTVEDMDALMEAIGGTLDGRGLTREELADQVAANAGPEMRRWLLSGWGSLLKPASYLGMLCSGPSRGQKVTFVKPSDWLGRPVPRMDPEEGWRVVCRRYLHAYGPASHADLAAWWGAARSTARRVVAAMGDEVTKVEVEGRPAWALVEDVDAMAATAPSRRAVRLLPGFDAHVMGAAPRTSVVPEPFKARVSRTSGWISPVVLQDGVAIAVWSAEATRDGTVVRVEPFEAAMSKALRTRVQDEVKRSEALLGGTVAEVRFVEAAAPTHAGPIPKEGATR